MQHLDQNELAERWRNSPRTLEQWRWQGKGPKFLKIGGRAIYRLKDIEAFEAENLHMNTVCPLGRDREDTGDVLDVAPGYHDWQGK